MVIVIDCLHEFAQCKIVWIKQFRVAHCVACCHWKKCNSCLIKTVQRCSPSGVLLLRKVYRLHVIDHMSAAGKHYTSIRPMSCVCWEYISAQNGNITWIGNLPEIINVPCEHNTSPTNAIRSANIGLMLGQRLRYSPNFNPTLPKCIGFAGLAQYLFNVVDAGPIAQHWADVSYLLGISFNAWNCANGDNRPPVLKLKVDPLNTNFY